MTVVALDLSFITPNSPFDGQDVKQFVRKTPVMSLSEGFSVNVRL